MSRRHVRTAAPTLSTVAAGKITPGLLAMLVGAAAALILIGFIERCYLLLDCSPFTFRIAAGGAWLGIALGQRLPRGLMRRMLHGVESRLLPGSAAAAPPEIGAQSFAWFATAIVALAAGLGAAFLPVSVSLTLRLLDAACLHFVWRDDVLAVVEAVALGVASALPFALLGLLIRSVHQLRGPREPWDVAATGGLFAGAAAACAVVCLIGKFPLPGSRLIQVGALLLLAAAMVAVCRPTVPGKRPRQGRAVENSEQPVRGLLLLALALVATAAAATTAFLVWVHVVSVLPASPPRRMYAAASLLLMALAAGVLDSVRRSTQIPPTLRGLGRCAALAGGALAAGAAGFNVVMRSSDAPFAASPGCAMLWTIAAAGPFLLVGATLGTIFVLWVEQAEAAATMGARGLRYMGLAAACAAFFGAVQFIELMGSYATLTAAALALVAVGGTVLIHLPQREARVGWDAASVFGAVFMMALLLPSAGEGWLSNRQQRPGRIIESWWATLTIGAHGDVGLLGQSLYAADFAPAFPALDLPPGRIGMLGLAKLQGAPSSSGQDWLPLDPELAERLDPGAAPGVPALRALRTSLAHYDTLVLRLDTLPAAMQGRMASPTFMDAALEHIMPGGALIVVLPNDDNRAAGAMERFKLAAERAARVGWSGAVEGRNGRITALAFATEPPHGLHTAELANSAPSDPALLAQVLNPSTHK